MKLLNVAAVLDREKRIQQAGHENEVLKELDDKIPGYAILSHRWGNEVSYKEMIKLMKIGENEREEVRQRDGYQKVIRACEQAMTDAYGWLWIDTCCIDKRCSEKLSEAINSMYRWYHNSQKCYVYLDDVDESVFPTEQDFSRFGKFNGWPEWFSRGWTLQELIAPKEVEFFNKRWDSLGTKRNLTSTLEKITRIPEKVLRTRERPCIAHIMSWAADRKTTRVEDRAYSLLGLFGVRMQVLYGEGSKAFRRLQLEILRVSSDHSVFAWNPKGRLRGRESVLADDPSCFRGCHDIEKLDSKEFSTELEVYMFLCGLDVDSDQDKLDSLRRGVGSPQLSTFDVTNLGIRVSLPVISNRDSPYLKAILPCRDRYGKLITTDLESFGHSFCKCLNAPYICETWPEFRSLYLDYSQDDKVKSHNLRLHDRRVLWYGFIRCGTFPFDIAGDTVLLSQGNNLIVLVYANYCAKSRFAVGLGCCLGQVWARIVYDEDPANQETWSLWETFAKEVYHILWNAPFDESHFRLPSIAIKDTHLPRSIWDARILCRRVSDSDSTDVMMDIQKCPGCCAGPLEYMATSEDCELWFPWPQGHSSRTFRLQLDGQVCRKFSRRLIMLPADNAREFPY